MARRPRGGGWAPSGAALSPGSAGLTLTLTLTVTLTLTPNPNPDPDPNPNPNPREAQPEPRGTRCALRTHRPHGPTLGIANRDLKP